MDWQVIFSIVFGAALAAIGWLYREVKHKVDKTHEEFLIYRTHVAERYVSSEQLTKAIENLNNTINSVAEGMTRIEARLNNQLDNRQHQ